MLIRWLYQGRKLQAQQAEKLLSEYLVLSKKVVNWLSDISSRLEQANNNEKGIKVNIAFTW